MNSWIRSVTLTLLALFLLEPLPIAEAAEIEDDVDDAVVDCPIWGANAVVRPEYRPHALTASYALFRAEDPCAFETLQEAFRTHTPVYRIDPNKTPMARVQLVAQEGVQLYVEFERLLPEPDLLNLRPGQDTVPNTRLSVYEQVGVGTTTGTVPLGLNYFAVGRKNGRLTEAEKPIQVDGPFTIHVHHEDHSGARQVGLWTTLGGLGLAATGAWIFGVGVVTNASRETVFTGLGIGGGGFVAAVTGLVIYLINANDEVSVRASAQ